MRSFLVSLLEWLKKYRMTITFFGILALFAWGYFYLYNYEPDPGRVFEGASQSQSRGIIPWFRENGSLISLFFTFLLVVIFVGMYFQQRKQIKAATGSDKKIVPIVAENEIETRFADVAGCDEAKAELELLVEFLRTPDRFKKLGATIPRGSLLIGDPGVGKTLLARAVAGEAQVPFMRTSGSEFIEKYVGVGASRVRAMFEAAEVYERCIIFIDEIDSVGSARTDGSEGGHREQGQTINQLLSCMDGFKKTNVIVIAATNRPDVLDPALLRPGRFSRHIVISPPDVRGREQVLAVHTRKVPLGADVDIGIIARGTPGFTGANLENLVNEAALFAALRDANHVEMCDFEKAKDKALMGAERKAIVMSDKERENTAYHESGHALVTYLLRPHTDPLHKVTIIPRGRTLGATMSLPEQDHYSMNKQQLMARIIVLFAGRIAEELFTGDVTTGAANDLERATGLARDMVNRWGMSNITELDKPADADHPCTTNDSDDEHLGMLVIGQPGAQVFSQRTLEIADNETKKILAHCYRRARQMLLEHRNAIEALTRELLAKETIDRKDIEEILSKELDHSVLRVDSRVIDLQQHTPQ